MTPHQHANKLTRRQRGSILIPAAAAVLVCVILLGAAQLGLYFSVKREAQNAVDLAALNNVILLDMNGYGDSPSCGDMQSDVEKYIENYPSLYEHRESLSVTCKRVIESNGDYSLDTAATLPANALEVRLDLKAQAYAFFGSLGLEKISATATAYLPPIDEFLEQQRFSVQYDTLGVNNSGLISQLLTQVGLETHHIDVLTHNGLANAKVSPSGLLAALELPVDLDLNVAKPSDLLELERLSVAEILKASATVLGQQELVGVSQANVLNAIDALVGVSGFGTKVPLFGPDGFLSIAHYESAKAALGTRIDWGEFLNTAVLLAQGDSFLEVSESLDLGIVKVDSAVRVIEPPSSAPLIVGAKASHANARVYIRAQLNLLLLKVDLPIVIELGQGDATLQSLAFSRVSREGVAEFEVSGALVNVCMGRFANTELFSRENGCTEESVVSDYEIVNALGIPIKTSLKPAVFSKEDIPPVYVDLIGKGPFESEPVPTFELNLSSIVHQVVGETVGGVLGSLLDAKDEIPSNRSKLTDLAKSLVGGPNIEDPPYENLEDFNQSLEDAEEMLIEIETNARNAGVAHEVVRLLGSVTSLVTGLLEGVLNLIGDLLKGIVCIIPWICSDEPLKDYEKLAGALEDSSSDSRVVMLLLTVLDLLLEPLEDVLNPVLDSLLDVLGVDLGDVVVRVDEFFSHDHFEGVLIHNFSHD